MTDVKTGILLWSQAASWPEMVDAAKRVDRLGYDHLWTWDHIYAIFGDPYQPIVEGWMTLAGWAMATEKTRLGLLVGANPFRNPGLTAKLGMASACPSTSRVTGAVSPRQTPEISVDTQSGCLRSSRGTHGESCASDRG